MARGDAKRREIEFKGFIQCELTDKQKQTLKAQEMSLQEIEDTLVKLIQEGYKVSYSWDNYNHCYQAFLSTSDQESEHLGWILAGRGSLPSKSLKQLFYKHYAILKEQWSSAMGLTRDELDD